MTDQAWERFEHSGSIADYLQYKEKDIEDAGSQKGTVSLTRMDVKGVRETLKSSNDQVKG